MPPESHYLFLAIRDALEGHSSERRGREPLQHTEFTVTLGSVPTSSPMA